MSEEQPKTLNVDGVEYPLSEFSDQERYMLNQVQDLTSRAGNLKFQLDQIDVARDFFTQTLISSLQKTEAEEVEKNVAGIDIAN